MSSENSISLVRIGKSPLRLRTAILSAVLILLNLSAAHAGQSDKTERLDPVTILLRRPQATDAPAKEPDANNSAAIACREKPAAAQLLPPDIEPLPFSTAYLQTVFEPGQGARIEDVPLLRQTTPRLSLVKTNISAVAEDPENPDRSILRRLIDQIGSVKFPPKRREPAAQQPAQSQEQLTPKDDDGEITAPNSPASSEEASAQQSQEQAAQMLSAETVKKVEEIISASADAPDARILAEMLQQAGLYEQAAYFYELALTGDQNLTDADKAWLLTQKALCLTRKNPQQAEQIYANVVSQYSATPWTELAQTRQDLTSWLNTDQPEKLIDQCLADLKKTDN